MVNILMGILCEHKKLNENPFGEHYVLDYFIRFEFQNRGSPHAHILLWLNKDPHEKVSEHMPKTIELIDSLLSVQQTDLPDPTMYKYQIHRHTFTCTKRGESSCRFGIPFWPLDQTQIFFPLKSTDIRRGDLRKQAINIRKNLETRKYSTLKEFFDDNNIGTFANYFNIIRSTLYRPTTIFKRSMDQCFTNQFHPFIAGIFNSNMDIQFILDEYSCAAYVVEYVNKSNRGLGDLRRQLQEISSKNSDADHLTLIKLVAKKFLNSVEMSAQEAAWFLLRQPMSQASRSVIYIPTGDPTTRLKNRKSKKFMDEEGLNEESTDIWSLNLIEKYEDRPEDLNDIYLAEFASNYTVVGKIYKKRTIPAIIRYNNYKTSNLNNYMREKVMLFLAFRCELVDILDQNKYIQLYNDEINQKLIMERRKIYEANIDIELILAEVEAMCVLNENNTVNMDEENNGEQNNNVMEDNSDDLNDAIPNFNRYINNKNVAEIGKRNCMDAEQYCKQMRTTNEKQRELILEAIHRLHSANSEPIQIFFTGPAGCGKTYTIKLLMDTYNRFSLTANSLNNAYLVCASTGKAAVAINGTTVHSLFKIQPYKGKRKEVAISAASMGEFVQIFGGVSCIIIDEISMLSANIFYEINDRIQQITGVAEPFGGLNVFFIGDLRQLPAIGAAKVYSKFFESNVNTLWQFLEYFPLTEVVRQSDAQFSSILTCLGDGNPLTPIEINIIKSRFRTKQWCAENKQNVVRLFHANREVNNYNMEVLKHSFLCPANNEILGAPSEKEAKAALKNYLREETAGLTANIPLPPQNIPSNWL